jgi:hypothetical protein
LLLDGLNLYGKIGTLILFQYFREYCAALAKLYVPNPIRLVITHYRRGPSHTHTSSPLRIYAYNHALTSTSKRPNQQITRLTKSTQISRYQYRGGERNFNKKHVKKV